MPVLKNARHEAFAQALAKGTSQDAAYAEAGFVPHRQNASRLMTNDDIRRRVEEIKAKVSDKAEWTSADRLRMLAAIAEKTVADDPRSAIAAIAEANRMQGSHAPAKREHSGPNGGPIQYADMTEEEIDARLAAFTAQSGEDDAGAEA